MQSYSASVGVARAVWGRMPVRPCLAQQGVCWQAEQAAVQLHPRAQTVPAPKTCRPFNQPAPSLAASPRQAHSAQLHPPAASSPACPPSGHSGGRRSRQASAGKRVDQQGSCSAAGAGSNKCPWAAMQGGGARRLPTTRRACGKLRTTSHQVDSTDPPNQGLRLPAQLFARPSAHWTEGQQALWSVHSLAMLTLVQSAMIPFQ